MDGHIQLANKILNNKTNLNQLPVINSVTLHSLLSTSNKNTVFYYTTPWTLANTYQCFKASSSKMLVPSCYTLMLCKPQNSQLVKSLNKSKKYNFGLTLITFDILNIRQRIKIKSSRKFNLVYHLQF
jgi:hypothetical protein